MNEPTEASPLELTCDACGGDGGYEAACPGCQGKGKVGVIGCPRALCTADVVAAFEARAQADLGVWPVAGGWLDQTKACLEAVALIRRLEPT